MANAHHQSLSDIQSEVTCRCLSRAQFRIAKSFYQTFQKSMQPRKDEMIWFAEQDVTIAALRLRPVENRHVLLHGVFVREEWRDRGVAVNFLRHVFAHSKQSIFCFCKASLAPLYQNTGMHQVIQLPAEIKSRFKAYQHQQPELIALRYD